MKDTKFCVPYQLIEKDASCIATEAAAAYL